MHRLTLWVVVQTAEDGHKKRPPHVTAVFLLPPPSSLPGPGCLPLACIPHRLLRYPCLPRFRKWHAAATGAPAALGTQERKPMPAKHLSPARPERFSRARPLARCAVLRQANTQGRFPESPTSVSYTDVETYLLRDRSGSSLPNVASDQHDHRSALAFRLLR